MLSAAMFFAISIRPTRYALSLASQMMLMDGSFLASLSRNHPVSKATL